MSLRSAQFDDIYFSPEDGLAETRHVFIDGNNLPKAWEGKPRFVIAETGFGTGLNFLAAWAMFEKMAQPDQKLHYISFEKYPLGWDDISGALARWRSEFGGRMDRLRSLYPMRAPGFHRLMLNAQVTLTLVFDDVNAALPQTDIPGGVDAWFLDGFAPSKNPDMWSETLFSEMSRLSRPDTTFATFTVAGAVRRGLEASGFSVEKTPGYGRKKEMLRGVSGEPRKPGIGKMPENVAIVGGGLAGTAAAFVLKRSGIRPVIFEKTASLASGASGNALGLFNPRLSAHRTAESDFYTAGFAQVARTLRELQDGCDIKFNPCGSLHIFTDAEKEKRLRGAAERWGWHETHMRILDAEESSRYAGLKVDRGALHLPDAGTVSPQALCRAYADGVDLIFNADIRIDELKKEYDAVILACGAAVRDFPPLRNSPVHTVRGQVTQAAASDLSAELKINLCFGGYLSPPQGGLHMLGATFQKWLDDCDAKEEDHIDNIRRLERYFPGLAEGLEIKGGRAALRTSSKDRFPLTGRAAENLYVSTAHGSHGIVSSLAAAHLLSDMILGAPRSLPARSVRALSPSRFAERDQRKSIKL
ncbi:MAG: bifunctional tRNA (5-methylaminomethyl-2-thiouridine)(34)-methyltransferase MnmD/FAD-dependent 5-carboxymethylaminomethyl-2-thiouridine(34) oxidoreductase MnmC [Proteobacteria bacterium]|nr:bifunctional tRNA (5-methylaminomethyl-2-thiouridine)(34)-methyltransferase MnmD/FAD-dependent 5-carboxymethylaminomethyl-2-thiouridine(34) oxidoreductase MnmC [Pseudomonadota bacterium]